MPNGLYVPIELTPGQRRRMARLREHGIKPNTELGNQCHYLALDPGGTTGFATFAENGAPGVFGHIPNWMSGVVQFMNGEELKPAVIIYEDYTIRGRGQKVDENAIKTRGVAKVIKEFASRMDAELVKQQASVLGIAPRFSGLEMPRDHSLSHWVSAFNHGWFYLTQKKVVVPRILWPEED